MFLFCGLSAPFCLTAHSRYGTLEPGTDHCTGLDVEAETKGPKCAHGCLFNVVTDISESHDLSGDPAHASVLTKMRARLTAAPSGAMPPQEVFNGDKRAKDANQQAMNTICSETGYLQPGDYKGPLPPAPPPSPSPPGPRPSPSPPPPGPPGCDKFLEAHCPRSKYPDPNKCLECTRNAINGKDPSPCKPRQRQAYCTTMRFASV